MRFLRSVALLVLGACGIATTPAGDDPLPYRLRVAVVYGDPLGPESVREEIERELSARLRTARCFRQIERAGAEATGEADLIVEVVLDRFNEAMRYETSMGEQKRPDSSPGARQRWAADVGAVVEVQVRRGADRALVKMKRSRPSVSRQAALEEDTHHEAYMDFVDEVVRQTRSYLCKNSPEKWEQQIRQARPTDSSD